MSACTECGLPIVPIVYGMPMPGSDVFDRAKRKELILGGCEVDENQAQEGCPDCYPRQRMKYLEKRYPQLIRERSEDPYRH